MSQSQFVVLGLAVGVAGLVLPRLVARFRLSRRIHQSVERDRTDHRGELRHVADYHAATADSDARDCVDDATWIDLDMDAVFHAVDFTDSQVGRQCLYHTLRTPQHSPDQLGQLEQAIQHFTGNPQGTRFVRDALTPLAYPRVLHLATLLFGDLPSRPKLWWVFPLLTVAAVCSIVFAAVWPRLIVVLIAVCIANIIIQILYRPRVQRLVTAFQSIPALVGVTQRLEGLNANGIEADVATFRVASAELQGLRRATAWLLFEPGTANEILSMLYEYVNLLFLLDINAFVFSLQKVSDSRPLLRTLFRAIGNIDSAQSIARWRASLLHWSTPAFRAPAKALVAEQLYHPLLAAPVPNSVTLEGSGLLISGSNMAGKTTFTRTLGVNAILAQTLNTVCATMWHAPYLRVRSSIGRADSLMDGKSHYLAEAESIRSLVRAKATGRQHLFLIDEIFRGTNTAERIAAGYGVLTFLASDLDIVVVATHDLELHALLGSAYAPFHFREHIANGTMSFDYVLRKGSSTTRNAIALLELLQFPDAVIADATSVLNGAAPVPTGVTIQ